MAPFGVTVRYRVGEAAGSRICFFHGLFHQRSEAAVLDRLRELHRFAARIEVVADPGARGQAAMDDRFGPGLVRIVPKLVPAE